VDVTPTEEEEVLRGRERGVWWGERGNKGGRQYGNAKMRMLQL